MKKSITIWALKGGMTGELSVCDAAQKVVNAGFDAIEVSFYREGEISLGASFGDMAVMARNIRSAGGKLSSLSTLLFNDVSLTANDREEREFAWNIAYKMLEAAAVMEIMTISISPGKVTPDIGYKTANERAMDQLIALSRKAEELGVVLCIENVWQGLLLGPIEFSQFIDGIGSPMIGACLDTGNTLLTGYPQHWAEILGRRIRKVHITDIRRRRGMIMEFVDPGKGDTDWAATIGAIKASGYNGYASVEAFYIQGQQDEARLGEICKGLDGILNMGVA